MWDFNIVVTMAREGRFRNFYGELARYGEFRRTEFYGLLLGRLAEPEVFLETVRREREARVIAFQDLGRAIPLRTVFTFCPRNFLERARKALLPFAKELAGRRLYVRLERRGFKGEILSPEAERALDRALLEELEGRGNPGGIDFQDPDAVVVLETIGDRCGVGLLTRETRDRYDFVRVG